MTELNRDAAEAMVAARVDAATDVTGFGLLGHLRGMLAASGCAATVDASAVELLPGVLDLARAGVVPGGTGRNHSFLGAYVSWGELPRDEQMVLADAQTSGGMLIATRDPARLHDEAAERGVPLRQVGRVEAGTAGRMTVTGRLAA
jgi:selenide,water dikinase